MPIPEKVTVREDEQRGLLVGRCEGKNQFVAGVGSIVLEDGSKHSIATLYIFDHGGYHLVTKSVSIGSDGDDAQRHISSWLASLEPYVFEGTVVIRFFKSKIEKHTVGLIADWKNHRVLFSPFGISYDEPLRD